MFIISKQTTTHWTEFPSLEALSKSFEEVTTIEFNEHETECYSHALDTAVKALNDMIQVHYGSSNFKPKERHDALKGPKGKQLIRVDKMGYHYLMVQWETQEERGWFNSQETVRAKVTSFKMEKILPYAVVKKQREMLNLECYNQRTKFEKFTRELNEAVEERKRILKKGEEKHK